MTERPSNLSLTFGVAASIILHLTVLVPLLLMAMTAQPPQTQTLQADLPPEDTSEPQEKPERDEPELGIDRGTPSSVSWIGYEEYEEHLAQLAEVEQAAFTRDPSGAMGTADEMTPVDEVMAPEVPHQSVDSSEPTSETLSEADIADLERDEPVEAEDEITDAPEAAEVITLPEPTLPHREPMEMPTTLIEEATESEADVPAQSEASTIDGEPEPPADAVEVADDHKGLESEVPTDVEEETAVEETEAIDEPELPQDAPADEPADEVMDEPRDADANADSDADAEPERESEPEDSSPPQRDAPPGEVRDGEESEKDADATSVIDVPRENWRLGRPLASKGVEIKPERPHFTLFQLTTASPRNPTVVIRFNREGVPNDASILRSSGDRSIDSAILASLYRWRAEGEAIKELKEKQTFDIQIRILLVRERRVVE